MTTPNPTAIRIPIFQLLISCSCYLFGSWLSLDKAATNGLAEGLPSVRSCLSRNVKGKQIHCGEATYIDDWCDAAVAQDGCAHQAVHLAQMALKALDDYLLLAEKFVHHKADFAIAGFDDDCESALAGFLGRLI